MLFSCSRFLPGQVISTQQLNVRISTSNLFPGMKEGSRHSAFTRLRSSASPFVMSLVWSGVMCPCSRRAFQSTGLGAQDSLGLFHVLAVLLQHPGVPAHPEAHGRSAQPSRPAGAQHDFHDAGLIRQSVAVPKNLGLGQQQKPGSPKALLRNPRCCWASFATVAFCSSNTVFRWFTLRCFCCSDAEGFETFICRMWDAAKAQTEHEDSAWNASCVLLRATTVELHCARTCGLPFGRERKSMTSTETTAREPFQPNPKV